MSKPRKNYTSEFKKDAVEYLLRSGKNQSEVSRELGIPYYLLSRWKTAYHAKGQTAFNGKAKLNSLELEVKRLKQALEESEMEKAILKKALDIFSQKD